VEVDGRAGSWRRNEVEVDGRAGSWCRWVAWLTG